MRQEVVDWWNGLSYASRRRVLSVDGVYGAGKTSRPRRWDGLSYQEKARVEDGYGKPIPELYVKRGPYRGIDIAAKYGISRHRLQGFLEQFMALSEEERLVLVAQWKARAKGGRLPGRKDSYKRNLPAINRRSELRAISDARIERLMQLATMQKPRMSA